MRAREWVCCIILGREGLVSLIAAYATVMTCVMAASDGARAQENAALKELAPAGKLRLGAVFAPVASAFFVTRDAQGQPHGVTIDLGDELARRLGVPMEFMLAPNSGVVTDATESGAVDVGFMPVDEERKQRVAFGPAYYILESTYLVTGSSGIKTLAEVDRPNVKVVGIANTTTIRAATRSLKNTTIGAVSAVGEAMDMLRDGKADAFALSRDSLALLLAELPGSLIVDGGFQQTGIAIAVPKNRPAALAYVTDFMEDAKAAGIVRRALDNAGLKNEKVAPPAR